MLVEADKSAGERHDQPIRLGNGKSNRYIDGTYLSKVPDWHAGEAPWKARQVLRMINKNRLQVNSICDVGCGIGAVLSEMQKSSAPHTMFAGFDISPQAIGLAKERENTTLRFFKEDFLAVFPPYPDLVLLLDVFEHVDDYIGFLDKLKQRTKWVIFHIPLDISVMALFRNSKWMLDMRRKYGHLHYFTKPSALATLRDVGFEVVDCFYTDDLAISAESVPTTILRRFYYEVRKLVSRGNEDFAAQLFNSYNLMVLAKGDLASNGSSQP
jgi:SAM-dependent methyltransferase